MIDWDAVLSEMSEGKTTFEYGRNRHVFEQGEAAESVFYLRTGRIKLVVKSELDKEAIVAVVGSGEIFGEGCLAGQTLRISTAVALSDCSLIRIDKPEMVRALHERHEVSELFTQQLLARNIRYEGDLVDQLFNNSERRLARTLLLLAHFDKDSKAETVIPAVNQQHLAQMVGTTRSRVSHFMNKFRELGFIDYKGDQLTVHSGLLGVVLRG